MVKKFERCARVRNEKNIAAPDLKVSSNVALLLRVISCKDLLTNVLNKWNHLYKVRQHQWGEHLLSKIGRIYNHVQIIIKARPGYYPNNSQKYHLISVSFVQTLIFFKLNLLKLIPN